MTGERNLVISVRTMVEFSIFGPDIVPSSRVDMDAGSRAHRARQRESQMRGEVSVAWQGERQGVSVKVTGRIDLLDETIQPPRIEEIKLLRSGVLVEPYVAHRAQAMCYAYMLGVRDGYTDLIASVVYVDELGRERCAFPEPHDMAALEARFFDLLDAYVSWQMLIMDSKAMRDQSLQSLPFPYAEYRPGQRELAMQVYTAIQRGKRLYVSVPTGAGKSAAVLYPSLKALGAGINRQVFYLTARTTARRAALSELERMRAQGLCLHALTINARDKVCPQDQVRCDPAYCPRAKGHYDRQGAALREALTWPSWDTEDVLALSDRHMLCPFEFSLALCEIADVVICDYNYAFDPMVFLRRVFQSPGRVTLLMDEAHNLPHRVRDMLSGSLDSAAVTAFRREDGKRHGRKTQVYRAATQLIKTLRAMDPDALELPDALLAAANDLVDALTEPGTPFREGTLFSDLLGFLMAARRVQEAPEDYRILTSQSAKDRVVRLFCLNVTRHLQESTRRMQGSVFFSATLSPLTSMRDLLGGQEDDACFDLPSPFPPEHLLVLGLPVNTRYVARDDTAQQVAEAIRALFLAHPGKYIVYFPSYAYLQLVLALLSEQWPELQLLPQTGGMGDTQREAYLAHFTRDDAPLLGLCVLGGVFSEGIDLPGHALIGVCVVGVGLPQVNREQEALAEHFDAMFADGFGYAYRYPGMHKVLQAAGRVIRSETDRGVVLLLDDRYFQGAYARLLPPHYQMKMLNHPAMVGEEVRAFWA